MLQLEGEQIIINLDSVIFMLQLEGKCCPPEDASDKKLEGNLKIYKV